MIKRIFYILVALFLAHTAYAVKELKVGFGLSEPPFIMDDNQTGIIVSLAEEALRRANYDMQKHFMTNKILITELLNGRLDAAMSIPNNDNKIYYSNVLVNFDNYAITKKSKQIKINSIEDLKGKTLVSWHNAPADLDDSKFTKMYNANDFILKEMPRQDLQVKAFLLDRFKVIIIDKTIFRYLTKKIGNELNLSIKDDDFDYHKIFSKHTALYGGFANAELRDQFNSALESMQKDGTYNKIVESFLNF